MAASGVNGDAHLKAVVESMSLEDLQKAIKQLQNEEFRRITISYISTDHVAEILSRGEEAMQLFHELDRETQAHTLIFIGCKLSKSARYRAHAEARADAGYSLAEAAVLVSIMAILYPVEVGYFLNSFSTEGCIATLNEVEGLNQGHAFFGPRDSQRREILRGMLAPD